MNSYNCVSRHEFLREGRFAVPSEVSRRVRIADLKGRLVVAEVTIRKDLKPLES